MTRALHWTLVAGFTLGSVLACGGTAENTGNSSASSSSGPVGGTTGATGVGGNASSSQSSSVSAGGASATQTSGPSTGTGGTVGASCPTLEPATGAACPAEGLRCSFANCQAPDYRSGHTLACFGGAWTLEKEMECPSSGECPSSVPNMGTGCDAATTPGPCSALDGCGVLSSALCQDGVWVAEAGSAEDRIAPPTSGSGGAIGTAATGAAPPMCPFTPPILGSQCCPSSYLATCDYSGSSGAAPDPSAGGSSGELPVPPTGAGGTDSGIVFQVECFSCSPDTSTWVPCP